MTSSQKRTGRRATLLATIIALIVALTAFVYVAHSAIQNSSEDGSESQTEQKTATSVARADAVREKKSDAEILAEMNDAERQQFESLKQSCNAAESKTIRGFGDLLGDLRWRTENCDIDDEQNIDMCVASSDPVINNFHIFYANQPLPYTRSTDEMVRDCRMSIAPTEEDENFERKAQCDHANNPFTQDGDISGYYLAKCGQPSGEMLYQRCTTPMPGSVAAMGGPAECEKYRDIGEPDDAPIS